MMDRFLNSLFDENMDIFEEKIKGLPPVSEEELSDEEVLKEIGDWKAKNTSGTVLLAHHYQHDEIVRFADASGDSLELARKISNYSQCRTIVFCGVHFMAETASMLAKPGQEVLIPDPEAGCFLADTAKEGEVALAWENISRSFKGKVIPITYINSSASLKAFVGEKGGAICTSSNAEKVIRWALSEGEKLFFLPDQHLGRNTCFKMGIPKEAMRLYDPNLPQGGLTESEIAEAKVILWYGYCSVHQGFTPAQIDYVRKTMPKTTVIVHPECAFEVVQKADLAGSTSYIISQIEKAPSGASFAVGTEINLVNRLAARFKDKQIFSLSPFQCLCTTMYRIRPRWLLGTLRSITKGKPENGVTVPEEVKIPAMKALNRMLELC